MFVFFKQKTAYEMRISDWRSDVLLCRSRAWLRTVARVRRPRGGGRGRRHPGRIAPAVEPVEAGGGTVLRDRFRRGAAATRATGRQTGRRGDWKSVVWGKSVLVRVDPGGRRTLTNTNAHKPRDESLK